MGVGVFPLPRVTGQREGVLFRDSSMVVPKNGGHHSGNGSGALGQMVRVGCGMSGRGGYLPTISLVN